MKCNCEYNSDYDEPFIEERIADGLSKIKMAEGGWGILYKCKSCGAYWEKYYPSSELHGGGPASLHKISAELAKEKYAIHE